MTVLIPDIISCYNTKQATDTNKDNGVVYSYCLHVVSQLVVLNLGYWRVVNIIANLDQKYSINLR